MLRNLQRIENQTLHIHGTVLSPWFRSHTYQLFIFKTPTEIFICVPTIKFRLLFILTSTVENEIQMNGLSFRSEFSNPFCYDLISEQ